MTGYNKHPLLAQHHHLCFKGRLNVSQSDTESYSFYDSQQSLGFLMHVCMYVI